MTASAFVLVTAVMLKDGSSSMQSAWVVSTAPAKIGSAGMPIGMQAMGRHWEEHLLLRVAYNAELRTTRRLPKNYFGPKL